MYMHSIDLKQLLEDDGVVYVAWGRGVSFADSLYLLTNRSILVLEASQLPSESPAPRAILDYVASFHFVKRISLPPTEKGYTTLVPLSATILLVSNAQAVSIFDVTSEQWMDHEADVMAIRRLADHSCLLETSKGDVSILQVEHQDDECCCGCSFVI